MADPTHPLMLAIHPLLTRIGATVVDPADLRPDDVPLQWDGGVVAGIRLTTEVSGDSAAASKVAKVDQDPSSAWTASSPTWKPSSADPLSELDRAGKQRAVRILEESGAFSYRKSVEAVAAALGISRFTVYNYLNRDRE